MAIMESQGRMRVFAATEKATGKQWLYTIKHSWDRRYYSFAGTDTLRFRHTLSEAKQAAVNAGDFRYV